MPDEAPPMGFSLESLRDELAKCPKPEPVRRMGASLDLVPVSLDPIHLDIVPGWSPSSGAFCWQITGDHRNAEVTSGAASTSEPFPDCIPVPEAPFGVMVVAGIIFAGGWRQISISCRRRFCLVQRIAMRRTRR